jgi:hypothetical protein
MPALLLLALEEASPNAAAIDQALQRCATSLPDEVRIIFARATARTA